MQTFPPEMTPVASLEWLACLPRDIAFRAIHNAVNSPRKKGTMPVDSLFNALNAFTWKDTPEGEAYWTTVAMKCCSGNTTHVPEFIRRYGLPALRTFDFRVATIAPAPGASVHVPDEVGEKVFRLVSYEYRPPVAPPLAPAYIPGFSPRRRLIRR